MDKLEDSRIPMMVGPIDMDWKWCDAIRCWIQPTLRTFNPTHDLGLLFLGLNFQIVISQECEGQ